MDVAATTISVQRGSFNQRLEGEGAAAVAGTRRCTRQHLRPESARKLNSLRNLNASVISHRARAGLNWDTLKISVTYLEIVQKYCLILYILYLIVNI